MLHSLLHSFWKGEENADNQMLNAYQAKDVSSSDREAGHNTVANHKADKESMFQLEIVRRAPGWVTNIVITFGVKKHIQYLMYTSCQVVKYKKCSTFHLGCRPETRSGNVKSFRKPGWEMVLSCVSMKNAK